MIIKHELNLPYVYPIDKTTLRIRLKVLKDSLTKVYLIYKNIYNHEIDNYYKIEMNVIMEDQNYQYYEVDAKNEIPYFKSQLTKRQNEIETYINVLEQEIDDLNEMQEAVLRNMNDENNSQMISVGGLFSEMVEIYDRKVELEQEYKSLHSFSLVNNNIIFLAQKSLKKNLALSLVIGFLIACCVGLGIETTKKIRKAIN